MNYIIFHYCANIEWLVYTANSITDKTSMINLRNMTINSLRNTYWVQYMGINDDRLEVLTRRVLFDKNYKQAQGNICPETYHINISLYMY